MALPILSKNRPVFVSRLKITSPIKNSLPYNVWKTAIPIKFIGVPTNQT
jgi:hypothetical protein